MMVRALLLIAFVFLFAGQANAHGRLTVPASRGSLTGSPDSVENAPISGGVNSMGMICRNAPAVNSSQYLHLTAGQSLNTQWNMPAPHVGDCFFYLSYDEAVWFKIAEIANCHLLRDTNYSITIPSYLPSSSHAVLRWEEYALHVRPTIEYYVQCVDVTIAGTAGGSLPSPQVGIPGHLPSDGMQYRDGFGQDFFFTGPPVASLNPVYTTGRLTTSQPSITSGRFTTSRVTTGQPDAPSPPSPTTGSFNSPPAGGCTANTQCPSGVCQIDGVCYEPGIPEPCAANYHCPSGVCMINGFCYELPCNN